jgi:hypothetical protein
MFMRTVALTASTAIWLTSTAPAIANPPYPFVPHKDANGNLWLASQPNSTPTLKIFGIAKTKTVTANACGLASLKLPTNAALITLAIDGNPTTVLNLPTQPLPKCLSTGQLTEARPTNFKTPDGAIVLINQSGTIPLQYLVAEDRIVKANTCGFVKLNNTATKPLTADMEFSLPGKVGVKYGTAPTQLPWLCREGIRYQPVR